MSELYFDAPGARAVLIGIGYKPAQIPEFRSAATFWPEVVLRLRAGIVVDGIRQLLTAAARDHPGNAEALALLAKFGGAGGPVAVLCLFADPLRSSKVRLDREARLFTELEELGGLKIDQRHAVRVSDIIRALLRTKPQILHFAGHGTPKGRLVFEDDAGQPVGVGARSLAGAITANCPGLLDCVVLNSCFTAQDAEAFRGAAKAVAGSVTAIKDDSALAFTRGFYTAIGAGSQARKAFESGSAGVGLIDMDTSGLHFVSFEPATG